VFGGYRLLRPWSSVDSGESKLNDFIRKLSFCRRGECGAALFKKEKFLLTLMFDER
jgi:hypothetical protein